MKMYMTTAVNKQWMKPFLNMAYKLQNKDSLKYRIINMLLYVIIG